MRNQTGFTLIEVVTVIVVLGIMAAVAVPRFVDMREEALEASKAAMSGVVKSAHALLVARNAVNGESSVWPSVEELASGIVGEKISAKDDGVEVFIDGVAYVVPTYSDSDCTQRTKDKVKKVKDKDKKEKAGDEVQCVGSIP
ncbi:MAG: type II secretion system protein [Pedobacter sp.]